MKILTAIGSKKINEQLKNVENVEIVNSDIQYKEGILEYLEKDKNVDIILVSENILGEIKIENLVSNIQEINNKINIIIFIKKKEEEKYDKNIQYIYLEKIDIKNILKIIKIKENYKIKKQKNIIKICGNRGSGKTIFSIIISLMLIKKYKILIIEENNKNIIDTLFFENSELNKFKNSETIKIKNNFYLLNNLYFIHKKIDIFQYLNKIKNEFDYIIIDSKHNLEEKENEKIINKIIFLMEPNLLEIKKAEKEIKKENTKIILNKTNINSMDEEIIENIIHQKIIGKIDYTKNINLLINHQFNIQCLNKKEKNNILKIIKRI